MARDPGDPTTKEREDHNATHRPFRSWCPICVNAKGREEAHRKGRGKERSCEATISLDYKTFDQEDDRDDKATAVVYKDDHTTMMFGHVYERKSASVIEKTPTGERSGRKSSSGLHGTSKGHKDWAGRAG